MAEGKFIVVEGADCTGKSTLVTLLAEWLLQQGIQNIVTRHPGATQIGKELRKVSKESKAIIPPRAEGLIMAADNSAFIDQELIPTLEAGKWVLGDRNDFISGLVYQIRSGASLEDLDKIQDATHPNPPKIDILFILKTDEESRQRRKQLKDGTKMSDVKPDRYEDRGDGYMDGVVRSYERLVEEQSKRLLKFVASTKNTPEPFPCVFYVDASRSVGSVLDNVTEIITNLLIKPS